MGTSITVRDITPGDKSWRPHEARQVGVYMDLYQGWIDTLQAFHADTTTGEFCLPPTAALAADREAALREYQRLDDRIINVQSAARKEKQMSRRAEMNLELTHLRADRDAARARL